MQVERKTVLKQQLKQNKLKLYLLGTVACTSLQVAHAAEEQFNDALRNANNPSALEQYRYSMQNDALGYYPEYWSLNSNLAFQPSANIISFAQRYPQSAMAGKVSCGLCRRKG